MKSARAMQHQNQLPNELGSLHAGNLKGFPEVFREFGGDPKKLASACGIDPQIFTEDPDDDIYREIPLTSALHLLAKATKEVNCPHFGLILGQRLESSLLGPIGFLMMHSPTVEAALQQMSRFLHLRVTGVTVVISSHAEVARITINMPIPGFTGSDQLCDLAMSNFVEFMRMACGKDWRPTSVSFSHQAPADLTPYRELFGVPVLFGQKVDAMQFPSIHLKSQIASATPSIGNVMQNYIVQIEERYKGDIVGQVRRTLPALLPTGKCTIERVADLFSMHRRTLHRHLAAENLTFEQMVDEARQGMATNALAGSSMPLTQVALLLGYRDASAFSRAFRRWSGASPSEWRKNITRQP